MLCKNCGRQIPDDAALCPYCGTSLCESAFQGPMQGENHGSSNGPMGNAGSGSAVQNPDGSYNSYGVNSAYVPPKKERKPVNKKALSIVIAVIAAVIVLFGGVYYLYSTKDYRAAEKAVNEYDLAKYQDVKDSLSSDDKKKIKGQVDELYAETEKEYIADKISTDEMQKRVSVLTRIVGNLNFDDSGKIKTAINSHTAFLNGKDAEKNNEAEKAYKYYSKINNGDQDYKEAVKKMDGLADSLKQKYYDDAKNKFDSGDYSGALLSIDKAKLYKDDSDVDALADQIAVKKKEADDAAAAQAAAEAAAKEQAKQEALAELTPSRDEINDYTFYLCPSKPTYNDSRCFMLPYLGVSDSGRTDIHIQYNYTGDDWIFFKKVIVSIDGDNHYVYLNYFDKTQEVGYGTVYELYDDSGDNKSLADLLQKIVNSTETVVRFEGDNFHYDYTVPDKDKQGMATVLAAAGY